MEKNDHRHPYANRKYHITAYDPHWPHHFEQLKLKIRKLFDDVIIEHIGSTSVPGMHGKPCIDVLVIVNNLKNIEEHTNKMEQAGFEYAGQFVMNDSLLFRAMKNNELLANIHFFPIKHPHIKEMLDLRDYLRAHPAEVAEYSKLKNELYAKYPRDYASYRKYKDEYMDTLIKRTSQTPPV